MASRRLLTITFLASVCLASAQKAVDPLNLVLRQFLVQAATGEAGTHEQLLASPSSVTPGQVLEQLLQATNVQAAALTRVHLQLPVPTGTTYLSQGGAGRDTTTEFSFDHGSTYGLAPLKRKVKVVENGQSVTREVAVSPNEYTNVRWTVPTLAAGAVLKLTLRVTVR